MGRRRLRRILLSAATTGSLVICLTVACRRPPGGDARTPLRRPPPVTPAAATEPAPPSGRPTEPERRITDFAVGPQTLLDFPLETYREAVALTVDDLTDGDRKAALSRIRQLPKLVRLEFYDSDLSRVDENDAVPPKVARVLIQHCKVSQGTLRWLAKFPAGTELMIATCNCRNLSLDVGRFEWVTFFNCEMSTSAPAKLVKRLTEVTFKECRWTDDQ